MNSANGKSPTTKTYLSRPAIGLIALLVAIVAAVVIIRQTEIFQLRPATGTAKAISEASAPPADAANR